MRLYVFLAFLIVCILAVNAAQQNNNNANKRTGLAKRKSTNGAVTVNSNQLAKLKPRARNSSKSTKKVRKVKPALARRPKKVIRRVVKKSNRKAGAPAKRVTRKNGNRNSIRRGSRGGSRKRLAKQELSDSGDNKSIGAGQATGDVADSGTSADKPAPAPAQPAVAAPAAAPAQPETVPASAPAPAPAQPAVAAPAANNGAGDTSLLSSPAAGASNPLSSSPFNIPKATGQNQAIGAAFSQSSNGGSAFAAGFASIGKSNSAGGYGQVNGGKQAANPSSENLNSNTAEEPASSDAASSPAEEGSGELAAFRRRPRHG